MDRSPWRAGLRRSSRRAGLVARISLRCAQAVKEVSADRCRFQVAAAAPSQRHQRGVVLRLQGAGVPGAGDRGEAGEGLGVAGPGRHGLDAVEVPVDDIDDALAGAVWPPGVAGNGTTDTRHLRADVTHNATKSGPARHPASSARLPP